MLRMKDTNKLLKNVLRALPAITMALPFFAPKKTSVVPFVLGAIGVAAVGGIAAVMIFSPRTRFRALDIAKDGYGKVLGQMDQLGISEKLGLASETARGNNLQSMALGQGMLQQGLQAQQAGAASTRGGSLAAAAAMRQQAAGQGAYEAQGSTMLRAQQAAEMANGRDMYQQQAGAMRAGDAQAQGLDQSQAIQQMQNELQQRQLGQKGQMGYDSLGQDVNIGANNAALGQHEQNAGIEDKSMQRHQGKLDQGAGWVGDAASVAGSFGGGVAGVSDGSVYGKAGAAASGTPPPTTTSDSRAKSNIRGLASVAVARKGMR